MKILKAGLASRKTTVVGSVLATTLYGSTVGLRLPETQDDWITFGLSVLLAVLSLLTKDADK